MIRLTMNGAGETARRLRRAGVAITNINLDQADEIAHDAKRRAPKDTRQLSNSIRADIADHHASVGSTGVKYAIPVHQGVDKGNRRIERKPFLRDAMRAHERRLRQDIERQVEQIARRANG